MTDEPPAPEVWVRESRLAQAVEARSRRNHWEQLGPEEATWSSTLEALTRAGRGVHLDLGPAGGHHGTVTELGPDHVRLVDPDRWRYLRLAAVEVLTPTGPAASRARGDGAVERVDRTFGDVLSRLAGSWVVLVLRSGAARSGRISAVGVDTVTLAGDPPADPAYVSSSAVVAVLGDGSG